MSTLNLQELKAIAQKATQGEWIFLDTIHADPVVVIKEIYKRDQEVMERRWNLTLDEDTADRIGVARPVGTVLPLTTSGPRYGANNAAHVAAFDPPTALALIARIEDLEAAAKQTTEPE